MRFGLGLGFNKDGVIFPRPFVVANRPRGVAFYDSVGNQFRAQVTATGGFNDIMKTYFDPTAGGVALMSTDGCSLLKSVETAAGGTTFMINDDSGSDPSGWTRGAQYSTNLSALTVTANTVDYVFIISGINDANPSGGSTKAKTKQALTKLKEFIREDFPNVQCAFLHIVHRNDDAGASNTQMQIIREAQLEICAEDSWFKRGPDTYDLDMQDQSHFTTAIYQTTFAERYAKAIAYYFKKIPLLGVLGPDVTAVSFNSEYMDLTVAQDAGTDFATISAGAQNTLALDVGGSIIKPASVERVNTTTLRAWFDDKGAMSGKLNSAYVAYGHMNELAQTSATVIKDNASDARPLRSKVISSVTNNDPLWDLSLNVDLLPRTGTKTYSSGALVSGITDRTGIAWSSAAGDEATYDATLFGGLGGLQSSDGNRFLQSADNSWTVSNTGFGGIVFEFPATTPASKYLLTFEGSNQVAFYITNGGALYYQQNSANGVELISGADDLRSKKNTLIWNFRSLTEVDFYLNGRSVLTIDPRDSLISWNRLTIFNRLTGDTGGITPLNIARVFHRNTAYSGDVTVIRDWLRTHYGTE